MDATAYLTRHGWSGAGHSLDPRGRGIRKPLLASRKNNTLGVGMGKHDLLTNQWWNKAFESGLKAIRIGEDVTSQSIREEQGSRKQVEEDKIIRIDGGRTRPLQTKWGSLYSGFVQGETLDGSKDNEVEVQVEMKGQEKETEERRRRREERAATKREKKEQRQRMVEEDVLPQTEVIAATGTAEQTGSLVEKRKTKKKKEKKRSLEQRCEAASGELKDMEIVSENREQDGIQRRRKKKKSSRS